MKHSKLITWLSVGLLGLAAAAFSPGMTAEAANENGFEYTVDAQTHEATITGYKGSAANVQIPSTLGGCRVTTIGKKAFEYNSSVASISIPNTVRTIQEKAFYGTYYLKDITIPASVNEIDEDAFVYGQTLESVTFEGATKIGASAFSSCSQLKTVNLSSSVPSIGDYAFAACRGLKTITIPSGVKEIGMYAFSNCSSLNRVVIYGNTKLHKMSFSDCISLCSVIISDGCESVDPFDYSFSNCPKLKYINGVLAIREYRFDSNGFKYPVLNASVANAIRKHFIRSIGVGFVDEYCQEMCEYIVESETDPWMNDALKARQLHDWLLRHCMYEDCNDGETTKDIENHIATSVFLSSAVNVRGEEVGETSCQGFSLAYTMLLAEADIESYSLSCPKHQWNLVKIDGKYYQVDVTWDANKYEYDFNSNPYSTLYRYFLLSDEKMREEHKSPESVLQYEDVTPKSALIALYEHKLTKKYTASDDEIAALAAGCVKTYRDKNKDGIQEYDFDLDGIYQDCVFKDQYDNPTEQEMVVSMLRFSYGKAYTKEQMNQKLPEILSHLHEIHKSPYEYVRNAYFPITLGPVSVYRGGVAKFKCDVFGEGLTYQWKCCNSSSGQYENVNLPGSKTAALQFRAGLELNGKWFKCFVTNRDGDVLDGWGGQLLTVCDY